MGFAAVLYGTTPYTHSWSSGMGIVATWPGRLRLPCDSFQRLLALEALRIPEYCARPLLYPVAQQLSSSFTAGRKVPTSKYSGP